MEEELGLGLAQANPADNREEKFVAKPNIKLAQYNQEVIDQIRSDEKAKVIADIEKERMLSESIKQKEINALKFGRDRGYNDGLSEGLVISRNTPQPGATESNARSYGLNYNDTNDEEALDSENDTEMEDDSEKNSYDYNDDYNMQDEMDNEGLGLR